jgi:protein-tyrosine phosphatase
VNFVTPQVAVGGRYFWPRRLRRAGITHVLSARRTSDLLDGFICLNNPMEDNGADQNAAYWLRTVELAVPVLAEPNHKLFVHCAAGKNRGPAHVYAILLALGHSPQEARRLIRTARRKATTRYFTNVEAAVLGAAGSDPS